MSAPISSQGIIRPVPILLTVRELDQGGIERDVAKIATHLDRKRFEPHVASYFAHGMRYEELRRSGVPLLHLPLKSLVSLGSIRLAWRLHRYIRQHRIQVVHAWDTSAVFVVPLSRWLGVPVVVSSLLGSRQLLDDRSHRQLRFTDRMVAAVVVNCEAMRRHLILEENAANVRIELCYNGVDTEQFYPEIVPRPTILSGASIVVGVVSALRPEKALNVLQEAFAQVRSLCPGMKLLIVGSGEEYARLQSNAMRLAITEDCVFVPATAAVADYLRAIDIFVLPSYSEAFSNALLEAMACGCCPVGSRVGGTPEMLGENEERGLLFPPGDASRLADRLSLLIREPVFRHQLAQNAAVYAKDTLNLGRNISRTMEIYESLLHDTEV